MFEIRWSLVRGAVLSVGACLVVACSSGARVVPRPDGTTKIANAQKWSLVEGQLVTPCDERQITSTTCSLRFNTDYRSWFGGYQFYPDQNRVPRAMPKPEPRTSHRDI